MKRDLEIMVLGVLASAAAILWFTPRGRSLAASAASSITTAAEAIVGALTRGERNNNPGNIRHSATVWQGQSADQTKDIDFVAFDAPLYGIRALAKTLKTYFNAHGLQTISDIISRWAPPSENDTGAYIAAVSQFTGFDAASPLDVNDPQVLAPLVTAIIQQENRRVSYGSDIINQGVNLA